MDQTFFDARKAFFRTRRRLFFSTGEEWTTETAALFYAAVDPVISDLLDALAAAAPLASFQQRFATLKRFYYGVLPPPALRCAETALRMASLVTLIETLEDALPLGPPPPLSCACLNCSIANESGCTTGWSAVALPLPLPVPAAALPPPPPAPPALQRGSAVCDGV
jgi:hypothetical protein